MSVVDLESVLLFFSREGGAIEEARVGGQALDLNFLRLEHQLEVKSSELSQPFLF